MWVTMSSFLAMLSFADLGIGNGLINAVASAYGRDDREEMRRYISSGFLVLRSLRWRSCFRFPRPIGTLPWFELFNVHTDLCATRSRPRALRFVVCCRRSLVPLVGIVYRVQMGMQRSGFEARTSWQGLRKYP